MSPPRKALSLPAPVLDGLLREVKASRQAIPTFDAEIEDLIDGALRPHWAALARALAPTRKNRSGTLTLTVRAHTDYCEKFELPRFSRLRLIFNPATGSWHSPTAAPWEAGFAGFAAHVFHIETGKSVGPFEVQRRLLALLGVAALRGYRDGAA